IMITWLADQGMTFTWDATPESRREAMTAAATNSAIAKHAVHSVRDFVIPGPESSLPVREYRPSDARDLPVLVWFHGGGWVTGNLETHDQLCRQMCDAAEATVLSIDYRLAPEAKFPGPVDDCLAAYEWVTQHASELGADPSRVAIGGDSAGGNLAAVVAILARDLGLPSPRLQLLVYPVIDHEFESAAMIDNAKGYFLEADSMRWFYSHYVRTPDDVTDWRMSPLRAPDLADVAPAVVITAEYDPLRDQGEAYVERLRAAAVDTEHVRADGVIHGFFGMHAFLPPAQEAWDVAIAALRGALEIE
ncbi:MAG TPA: alpha/beta hydrolase, partial [Acidimicrobiia bacterium]|nr:alpha/beta hydrolase [Acidimicrobiia bacterium]